MGTNEEPPTPDPQHLREVLEAFPLDSEEVILNDVPLKELEEADMAALGKFTKTHVVALNGCGLKSLPKLPELPDVEVLELCDNDLEKASDLEAIAHFTKLQSLILGGCKFSLASLEPLAKLKVVELDIFDTPAADEDGHREALFGKIPTLIVLNGADKEGQEVDGEDDDVGSDFDFEEFEEGTEDEDEEAEEEATDDDEEGEEESEDAATGKRKADQDGGDAKRAKQG